MVLTDICRGSVCQRCNAIARVILYAFRVWLLVYFARGPVCKGEWIDRARFTTTAWLYTIKHLWVRWIHLFTQDRFTREVSN